MAFSDTLAHLNAPMDERAIAHGENHSVFAMAMVYLSETHVKPGLYWDEYIRRMDLGIRDALQLGVSLSYLLENTSPKLQQGRGSRMTQSEGVKTPARKVVRKPEGLVSSDYRSQRTNLPEEGTFDWRVRPSGTVKSQDLVVKHWSPGKDSLTSQWRS